MDIADEYFNNCRKIVVRYPDLMGRKVRYQVFAREDGVIMGSNKAVNLIKGQTYGPIKITGLEDGKSFVSEEPVLTIEGNFYELVTLETTYLGFLAFSGAVTTMRKIVEAADGVSVIDMSARHYPWQIIEEVSLAAYLGGAAGTSTQAGYDYVQKWHNPGDSFKLYASLPHAIAALVAETAEKEGFYPSVLAAKLFHEIFPEKPITILVDYEGKELDVAKQAYEIFGDKLFAVRLDTHGGRNMQGTGTHSSFQEAIKYLDTKFGISTTKRKEKSTICPVYGGYYIGPGVTVEATFVMRDFLDQIGAKHTKIVVSSGFNETKVTAFRRANAPMDFIGTGSWVKFMMFTADISHVWENGEWKFRTKVGRVHGQENGHKVLLERT